MDDPSDPASLPTAPVGPSSGQSLRGALPGSAGPEGRIGPWRILSEIGQGGMGAVYLAARADDQYEKHVALKLIRGGQDRADVVARFRRERQILAGLDHPNIARLIDGGSAEDGRPYFVMELVAGSPIDRFCAERSLSTEERLRLFRTVCAAVEYAHRKLVVHRDIKPSNILVTPEGLPKLLDFGIARILSAEVEGDEAPTATGMAALTPAFASPEQVKGEPITTATDVYSLGVLLYVLLTDRFPYRLKSAQAVDVLRAVCEDEAQRPSTAVGRMETVRADGRTPTLPAADTADRLRKRLRGDLDTILLTALRKEPQHRYPSVEAFSDDVRRHLERLPVRARKPTSGYRVGRFVSRNRWSVAAVSALLLVLLGSGASLFVQSVHLARERDKAARLAGFMVDLFKLSGPEQARGSTITAREILDRGASRIGDDPKMAPEVRASLLNAVGSVYTQLGLYDQALPLLQRSLVERRRSLGPANADVAESLHGVATVLWRKGRYDEAEALFREAIRVRRAKPGEEPFAEVLPLLGLGNVLDAKGDYQGAKAAHEDAVALLRRVPDPPTELLAQAVSNLAASRMNTGDGPGAVRLMRESLDLFRQLGGQDDPRAASTVLNLAALLGERGDYAEAEKAFEEGLAVYRKVLGDAHPEVARNLNNFAVMLQGKGDYERAEALAREAVGVYRKSLGKDHPDQAPALDTLAGILNSRGAFAAAEPLSREAVAVMRKAVGEEHPFLAFDLTTLADSLAGQGKTAEAERLYARVVAMQRKLLPADSADRAYGLVGFGTLRSAHGDPAGAEPLLREALSLRQNGLPAGHWRTAEAESALGACLARLGRVKEAGELLRKAEPVLTARGPRTLEAQRCREALERLQGLPKQLQPSVGSLPEDDRVAADGREREAHLEVAPRVVLDRGEGADRLAGPRAAGAPRPRSRPARPGGPARRGGPCRPRGRTGR